MLRVCVPIIFYWSFVTRVMENPDKTKMPMLIMALVMIISLPLLYLLVSRVLLPLAWNEPQFQEEAADIVE